MEDEIDIGKVLGSLWRRKFRIASISVAFLVLATLYAFMVPVPVYTGQATVALETSEQNLVDIESVVPGLSNDQSTVNTELEVFRSRILIERVVQDLNLIDDPELNASLREPAAFSKKAVIGFIREKILGLQPPAEPPSDQRVLDQVTDALLSATSVTNVPKSLVFRVNAVAQSPEKAARIANRLAELYIQEQIRVKTEKTQRATLWLSERVAELQISLETAENELKNYSSNTDLISSEGLVALNRQFKELRERLLSIETAATAQRDLVQQLKRAKDAEDYELFAELANDRAFSLAVSSQLASSSTGAASALLEEQSSVVLEREILALERLDNQLDTIGQSVESVAARIDLQSTELVKLQQLTRETEASRVLYEAFLSRLKETSIQEGIQAADSRILSNAIVPRIPTGPKRSRIMALGLIVGALIGALLVLLQDMSNNTFRTAEDLEETTQVSVLGQIPVIPAQQRSNVIKYLSDKPNSGAAESIRNLRTSLLLANVDKNPQFIMSTSSIPGEGKTTQSIALAFNFAQLGEKVLLIEGDIRRRVFSDYFPLNDKSNFLKVLSGEISLDEAIQSDQNKKVDILLGAKSSVNAADLFSTNRFEDMIKTLRGKYDRIIMDTPPVLAVPDARVIGQAVDSIIYAVKWDSTSKRQVIDGLKALNSVNLSPSGFTLSQVNQRSMTKYGYGSSYGQYQGYYEN